jgi:hypothetical protein
LAPARSGGAQPGVEVHLHRPFEFLVAGAQEAIEADADRSDVVGQHVDAAVLVECALDEERRALRRGEVDRYRGDPVQWVEVVGAERSGDNVHAFGEERSGDGEADAFVGSGHDGDVGEWDFHDRSFAFGTGARA